MKVLSCTRYLGQGLGLALLGHDERAESFEGNFYQLLLLEASGDHKMKAWLEKREYTSPDIINDMIKLMGTAICKEILAESKGSRWYAFIANEATDISHTEHISLSIRWINDIYQIF